MASLISQRRLDEDTFSAVLARVAYRCIVLDYKNARSTDPSYEHVISLTLGRFFELDWHMLYGTVLAFSVRRNRAHLTIRQCRDEMVIRSRQAERNRRAGNGWRRVPPCY